METYTFTAHLTRIDAKFLQYILIVPEDILESIGNKGKVRTEGTINGHPFALAIQNLKTGERFFSISAPLRKAAKIQVSQPVTVAFKVVDPNKLDIPEELTAVLEQDQEGKKVFDAFTIGYKRGLIHYITSVKNVDSRIKRAMEIITKAKYRQLNGQREKEE